MVDKFYTLRRPLPLPLALLSAGTDESGLKLHRQHLCCLALCSLCRMPWRGLKKLLRAPNRISALGKLGISWEKRKSVMALGLGSLGRAGGGRLGGPTAMPSSGTELPGGSGATYDRRDTCC